MISIIDSGKLVNTEANPMVPRSCEMVGLSTDDKPTGLNIGNGWSFIEMDTGKVYFYNAADTEWIEFAGNGGGSSGGGSNVMIVNCDESTYTLDKTWSEINSAEYAEIKISSTGASQFMHIDQIAHSSNYAVIAHGVAANGTVTVVQFVTDSESGYPALNMGG